MKNTFLGLKPDVLPVSARFTTKGGVPGGHNVLCDEAREPFVPPMRECHSILLRHSDVVVDVGAYCGTYALWAARFPVKKVVAYEPTQRTFTVLESNKKNLPNLECKKEAVVGDDRDFVELFISSGIGVTNSTILSRGKVIKEKVKAVSYVNAVRGASVVKVDVEGAEYGFPLAQPGIRALIVDFHPIPGRDLKADVQAKIEEIMKAGFSPVITPNFKSGWDLAGSWIRDVETDGVHEALMNGKFCCGCGVGVNGKGRTLCQKCQESWSARHRKSFMVESKVRR